MYKKPFVIAEIGCNHMGSLEIAKELVDLAKSAGADVAKFQTRDNKLLLTKEQYDAPHPNPVNSYGITYGAHREYLEFSIEEIRDIYNYCNKVGIIYATSVWDINSAKNIVELGPSFIKIPSACNNNFEMLRYLRDNYFGEIHISVGMTKLDEESKIVELFEETNSAKNRLVIYSCTSGYPVPFEDVALLEIRRLSETYGHRVKEIGFSGHHLGIAIDIAAYTLGARIIERHFTKDRTWKGTDHGASLEPQGLVKLCRDLRATYQALNYKSSEILPIEKIQREKLKNRK